MAESNDASKEVKEGVSAGSVTYSAPKETPTEKIVQPVEPVEDVPDPDEDDLDDLDDMLDDFSGPKASAKPATSSAASRPADTTKETASAGPSQTGADVSTTDEEFAKELQAGMADLLGELEKSPDMQAQLEDVLKQMTAEIEQSGSADSGRAAGGQPSTEPSAADASFQDTIRRTMERMQNSGDQATEAVMSDSRAEDFVTQMLKQFTEGEAPTEDTEEAFTKMLMGMMEHLTNKDILYEPMKELDDKFPAWFEKNRDSTPADELKRFEDQQVLVTDIVKRFESPDYKDSNPADREYIFDLMQKMQALGSPPEDLVGDLATAQEALAATEDTCNPQ